jgi:predicted N-acetyltransferase YhbS
MNREPELFDWKPAPAIATVTAFPLSRCIGKARTVAKVVMRCKTAATQQAAFDRAALAIARKLRAAGIGEAIVAEQIKRFAELVNAELRSSDTRRQA